MEGLTEVRQLISEITGVDPNDFGNRCKKDEYVLSRQLYASVLKELKGVSFAFIGKELGRNHATIIHALKEVDNRSICDKHYSSIHSDVLQKADLIFNGEPVPVKESDDVKDLKFTILRMGIQIDTLKNEIAALNNENQMLKKRIKFMNLSDSFNC